jgi:phytanoyl-CoA hydroxylase
MATLEPQQLQQFEDRGYLVLEGFVGPDTCSALRRRAEALVHEFDPREVLSIFSTREQSRTSDDYFLGSGDRIRFFFEEDAVDSEGRLTRPKEQSINKIGHALHDLDPLFDRFSRSPELAALVADLGIAEPLLVQSMYIFKQPGIGGEVTCHQDASFLYTDPPSVVGFWFALEDATQENGCLWVLEGGHRHGLKSRFLRAEAGGTRFEIFDHTPWPLEHLAPVEVPAGTLVVLDGLLPHMSYANRSSRSRHAYTLHAIDARCEYPPENWLRRGHEAPLRGF